MSVGVHVNGNSKFKCNLKMYLISMPVENYLSIAYTIQLPKSIFMYATHMYLYLALVSTKLILLMLPNKNSFCNLIPDCWKTGVLRSHSFIKINLMKTTVIVSYKQTNSLREFKTFMPSFLA